MTAVHNELLPAEVLVARLTMALSPGKVVTDEATCRDYGRDRSGWTDSRGGLAVVFAESAQDVQTTLAAAHELGVPVVTRGAGTGLSGGAAAVAGGIVLSLERMNRILELSIDDELAVVEPGVLNGELNQAAAAFGLRFAPDPASSEISSVGGNIATNAGGLRCLKYGATRESVLGLSVVLADGRRIEVGRRSIKGVVGLDLTALFVGSEGTLGVIVTATVRLQPIPVATETVVAFASSAAAAASAVRRLVRSPARPAMLELLDHNTLLNIDGGQGTDLAARGDTMLLIQTDGYGADREAAEVLRLLVEEDLAVTHVTDPLEAERYVELRRNGRVARQNVWGIGEDVAVPRSRLTEMFEALVAIGVKHDLEVMSVAHAGDGNLHPGLFLTRSADEEQPPARLDEAADELVRAALALGGTISGEHGIGATKVRWIEDELGPENLALQRRIKRALDPRGILNPGKWLDLEDRIQEVAR